MARTRGPVGGERSLDSAMREPSTVPPNVVVLDFVEEEPKIKDTSNPKKDLWLSSSDGRYQSNIIPVRVGPHAEEFPVHREILRKSEYFRRALDGQFREAETQSLDLPEEDPSILSFVVAWLYEERYIPIKSVATVLIPDPDKGKGKEFSEDVQQDTGGDATDSAGSGSDGRYVIPDFTDAAGNTFIGCTTTIARSRRRRDQRRRRVQQAWEQRQRKEPGRHRPDCNCASCTTDSTGPPCWNCGFTRRPPPPPPRNNWNGMPPPPQAVPRGPPPGPFERMLDREIRRRGPRNHTVIPEEPPAVEDRMTAEDLRTWSYTYSLSIDVYVCANKYLMQDFKAAISTFIINNFEIAGLDAALPSVLKSCKTLHDGVSPRDPLLRKIFARVGFLQARLWKKFQEETNTFYDENPKLVALIMKEMIERREEDVKDNLPAMDRPVPPPPLVFDEIHIVDGPGPRRYRPPL